MSKPLRVPLEGLVPGRRRLEGPLLRYVSRVHRLGPGDRLACFDPVAEVEADGVLESAEHGLLCRVDEVRPTSYRALPVTLLQGLAKGTKPDDTLRDATALGVSSVIFVETERAVVHVPSEREQARAERWRRIAAEAARQSGRGNLPRVEGPLPLARGLAAAPASRRIMLTPGGPPLLVRLRDWSAREPLALLVGPEGGLSELEQQVASAAGFLPAALGTTILRTELAAAAALGVLVGWAGARSTGEE